MLDERGAALDPVPTVAIQNIANLTQLGVVDVAADNTFDPATACLVCHSISQRKPRIAWRS